MALPVSAKGKAQTKNKLGEWRKTEIAAVKKAAKEILTDRKKANNLLEIIVVLETDDVAIVSAAMHSLCAVFTTVIGRGELSQRIVNQADHDESDEDKTAEEQYRNWLGKRYNETVERLFTALASDYPELQQNALTSLLKFVHAESARPSGSKFPEKLLKRVLVALLSSSRDTKRLINCYVEYLQYEDFKLHTLRLAHKRLECKSKKHNDVFLNNCFVLLEQVTINCDVTTDRTRKKLEANKKAQGGKEDIKVKPEKLCNLLGTVWLSFLRKKMNGSLHRRILVILHDKVMPSVEHPLLLTDFLMDSYKLGGPISLLALNGLFILMQKHNLELPDFYQKLYALFDPGIFHTKYRARFFYLADIFLSSTHLPAYMMAAFIKRLARLSLTAPPHCIKLVIPFIRNLLIRHPSLDRMLHDPEGPRSLSSDPYLMNEPNMVDCRALESSLWELQTLRQHYYPGVAVAASIVDKQLPPAESDISDLLELDASDLVGAEAKRQKKDTVAVNFERPSGLLCGAGNMDQLWTL